MVSPIPDGFSTVTPHFVVKNCSEAMEFYKKAFGAEEVCCMPGPDGKTVMHAGMRIGNSPIMLNDEFPMPNCAVSPTTLKGTTCNMHLYVEDVDASFQRAVDAGATPTQPVMDTFWGDRYGKVTDPYGHYWSIATHKEDLTPEQIQANAERWFAEQGNEQG